MIKIAINGFGRIGRAAFKNIVDNHPDLEVVSINDLTEPKILAHLLRYDSVYGIYRKVVKFTEDELLVDGTGKGKRIRVFAEKDPSKLPWREMGIDIVLECTGGFRHYEDAVKHIQAGAKKVIISAPSKDPEKIPSFVLGVNEDRFEIDKYDIVDMGSCTTNCLAPVAKVLNDHFGIIKGLMTTVHSYTSDQRLLDAPHKDLRRARAAALNIVLTTTGAAKAIERVIPQLKGKLNGMAIRVPTPTVSVVDLTCHLEKQATSETINYTIKKASQEERLKGILGIEDAPLVSSDYVGNSFSSIVDAGSTMAIGDMVKVIAWYDNEWAYATRLAEFAEFVGKRLK
ncbi:MAG TPA: type I glyceraldehyde-3-phosphate dehydrogenase [bacterium]|nr:type I glyceraldehyde-3-phosphate dehydrogenase [bacterium]